MIDILLGLLEQIWYTLDGASFYILVGILISGLLHSFISQKTIIKYTGKPSLKSVLYAGMLGIPLPLCSCGVLPTAISLRKSGASKGSVLSFLISTPESGIDSIAISYALLDPIMTIYRPAAAFITAIIAGVSENFFDKKEKTEQKTKPQPEEVCKVCDTLSGDLEEEHSHNIKEKLKFGMHYAFVDLLGDISLWLIFGLALAGLISYFVPEKFIVQHLGFGWHSLLLMLVIGIPLYICATASTPIAAALILKGISPGAALVFLLAGPATNMAGILSVGKFLGKKAVIIYLVSISVSAIFFGIVLNQIYILSNINIQATMGQAEHIIPGYIKITSSLVLILLMGNSIIKTRKH
ncbi:MAG: SO_0444 family Cu/Zn efflux transporter [Elusimicrobiota bacterium]